MIISLITGASRGGIETLSSAILSGWHDGVVFQYAAMTNLRVDFGKWFENVRSEEPLLTDPKFPTIQRWLYMHVW